jgi:hypothetical protein
MSLNLHAIKRTPLRDLTPREHFMIEVDKFLQDIRRAANSERMSSWKNPGHLQYLVGRLHGCIFGFSSLAIFHGWHYTYEEVGGAAMNEADFLCGQYQYPEAA